MRGKWPSVLGTLCMLLLLSAMGAGEEGGFLVRSKAALATFVHGSEAVFGTSSRDQENSRVVRSFINQRGQQCQVLEQTIVIDGESERATGTACRRWNGQWALWRGMEAGRR